MSAPSSAEAQTPADGPGSHLIHSLLCIHFLQLWVIETETVSRVSADQDTQRQTSHDRVLICETTRAARHKK